MKIIINANIDTNEKTDEVTLTNEFLDNYNFMEIQIGDKEYTFSVEDLFRAVKVFEEIRKENKQDEE